MIRRCRACGVIEGGLVSKDIPMQPWPQPDLCPQCPADTLSDADVAIAAIIEAAIQSTKKVREAERAGEVTSADIMEMRSR